VSSTKLGQCIAVIFSGWSPLSCSPPTGPRLRVTVNLNPDWRFINDDPAGAQARGFDDSRWTAFSAPHTYNDMDSFDNWSTPRHCGNRSSVTDDSVPKDIHGAGGMAGT
jgi:hypothetical protein